MSKQTFICPICDATVNPSNTLEESEITNCSDCQSRLVLEKNGSGDFILNQAPQVEEDWGQ